MLHRTFPVVVLAAIVAATPVSASTVMVINCLPPTGLNIASDIERDKPKDPVPEVYDAEANDVV